MRRAVGGVAIVALAACSAPDRHVPGTAHNGGAAGISAGGDGSVNGGDGGIWEGGSGQASGGAAGTGASSTVGGTGGAATSGGSGGTGSSGGAAGADSGGGGGSGATGGSTGDPYGIHRQQCVDQMNTYRTTMGLTPLTRWTLAESCADGQAVHDSQTKAHDAFGQCGELAQNECPGWSGSVSSVVSNCLQTMFGEGPGTGSAHGHYNNIMNSTYKFVACGFYVTPAGSVWATQDFH